MSTVDSVCGPVDTAPMTRSAVVMDFGGVITTSVLRAFEEFGELLGAPPGLILELLRHDHAARTLLVEHECGRIDADVFDRGFADRLCARGVEVQPDGLAARMQAGLRRDDRTVRLIEELRAAGAPIALVSNAFGRGCYAGFDVDALVDVVVISSEVGVRKPSRRRRRARRHLGGRGARTRPGRPRRPCRGRRGTLPDPAARRRAGHVPAEGHRLRAVAARHASLPGVVAARHLMTTQPIPPLRSSRVPV
jgi:putative hydrolase of the HAD superfamily